VSHCVNLCVYTFNLVIYLLVEHSVFHLRNNSNILFSAIGMRIGSDELKIFDINKLTLSIYYRSSGSCTTTCYEGWYSDPMVRRTKCEMPCEMQ
jgi:hypothetical protein